ncbi:hypothetical protein N2152v2_000107 [Parachlorella kessleri]
MASSDLGSVDAYALPDESFTEKFYDSVVDLRYGAPSEPEEEPAIMRHRSSRPASSGAAQPSTQPQQSFRVATSAMFLARASEKFKRALHPDWSGHAKVLMLDIEEGQVDVYRHLLHHLHMSGMPEPWLPEGLSELVALLVVAGKEMVETAVLSCAETLVTKVGDMSQEDATAALSVALHTETDSARGQAALAKLRQATLDRLVALLSPLQQFWSEQPEHQQRGSSLEVLLPAAGPALLPRELLEHVLASDGLRVDSEETVLATVLAWLQQRTAQLSDEEKKEHAAQLLSYVRWGLVRPSIAAAVWHASELFRAFDPQRQLLSFLLLAKQMPDLPEWWPSLRRGSRKWWQPRTGGSPEAVPLGLTFHLQASHEPGLLLCSSKPIFTQGLVLALELLKPRSSLSEVRVVLRSSFEHMGRIPAATSSPSGNIAAFPVPLQWVFELERADTGERVRLQKLRTPIPMTVEVAAACNGVAKDIASLDRLGQDFVGQQITAESLLGPHSPFRHGGELVVHGSITFL